jgi:hypothetical protein
MTREMTKAIGNPSQRATAMKGSNKLSAVYSRQATL